MIKRLFIAINLPQEIKDQLAELVLKLQKSNKSKAVKWVAKENLHLTLHFLGFTPEEKIYTINQKLETIVSNYPTLTFQLSNSINAFPDLNNPKVIFLKIKEFNDGKTMKLQKETGKTLEKLGCKIDKRPFSQHLTLGRAKFKTNLQIPNFHFPASDFQVKTIDLMESILTPQGPIYSIIQKFPFK